MIRELSTKDRVVGSNSSQKLIRSGKCSQVYLACDAQIAFSDVIEKLCIEYGVAVNSDYTAAQLADACGIDVKCAVVAIKA